MNSSGAVVDLCHSIPIHSNVLCLSLVFYRLCSITYSCSDMVTT